MFYVIVGGITFIAFILLIIVIIYNKFQFCNIKVEEAEANIGVDLKKKLDLIRRCIPIIKEELKLKEFLEEVNDINEDEFSHFELNDKLTECSKKLFNTVDDNDKLYKSDALVKILNEYNENETDLVGTIKFYNDTIVDYNHLILAFPSNIIRHIFGYKKKEFYSHEKREVFEILKEDKKN